jgi:hypothetical protein
MLNYNLENDSFYTIIQKSVHGDYHAEGWMKEIKRPVIHGLWV